MKLVNVKNSVLARLRPFADERIFLANKRPFSHIVAVEYRHITMPTESFLTIGIVKASILPPYVFRIHRFDSIRKRFSKNVRK